MTKTIAQVVEEFRNRETRNIIDHVEFVRNGGENAYGNVTNLYRDDIKVEIIDLDDDDKAHKYEFDAGVNMFDGSPLIWSHYVFRGKIIALNYKISTGN